MASYRPGSLILKNHILNIIYINFVIKFDCIDYMSVLSDLAETGPAQELASHDVATDKDFLW